jgi:hypothetical protein
MSPNNLTISIPTRGKEPATYKRELHAAISQIKMLVFERRELSLAEEQTYALHVLTDLQEQLVE